MFYELAQRPQFQARVRAEIRAARAAIIERGDNAFSLEDLDGMKVTLATIKVRCAGNKFSGIRILMGYFSSGNASLPSHRVQPLARREQRRHHPALRASHRKERRDDHRGSRLRRPTCGVVPLRVQSVSTVSSNFAR